ncbi:MAG TPA: enoyl-CoA hydratase-related protein [Spirochaetota bacterium]|nr:enoyl-CoA hydratase-related protein [Spirochaetota bacterium]
MKFPEKTAETYGLVNRATPKGQVVDEAKQLAKAIASRSRLAVRAAMKAVREGMEMDMLPAQKFERELFGTLCETDDKKEGVAAFLEKREPAFKDK